MRITCLETNWRQDIPTANTSSKLYKKLKMAVSSARNDAKRIFEARVNEYYDRSKGRVKPWTKDHILQVIEYIDGSNERQKMTTTASYFSKSYDMLFVDGIERVILKKPREDGSVRIMLPKEEFFDVIQLYHTKLGHVGYEKLCDAVRQRYVLPRIVVRMFISTCDICCDQVTSIPRTRKKRKVTPKKVLHKAAHPAQINSEGMKTSTPIAKKFLDPDYAAISGIPSRGDSNTSSNSPRPYLLEVPQAPPSTQKPPASQPPIQPQKLVPSQVSAPKPIAPKPSVTPVSPLQQLPPPPPPEVCLRWNSYHSNMQATFPSLLNNEQFVDVTLACEGRSIKCHKMMLSACSAYFEELLSQNPCQHPIVLMKDLKYWEVQALVDFMYRGEVNVAQDKLPSLLAAAEALQIKGLAGPAFSSHDEESMQSSNPLSSAADDYLDESTPSPSGGRRAKRRRVLSSAPSQRPQTVQPPQLPVTPTRSSTGKRSVKSAASMPSTSNYHHESPSPPCEPPTRRQRKSDSSEVEIKIEPIDIEISNDSMDQIEDNFMDKTYDPEAGDGGELSCHGDDPGGTSDSRRASGDSRMTIHGQVGDQMDFDSNNGTSQNDQNFKYEDGTSQGAGPDIPGTSYQETLSQPSSSGGNVADDILGHM